MKGIFEKIKQVKELFFTDLEVDKIREKKNMETNLIYCFGVGLMLLLLSIVNFRSGSYAMATSTIIGAIICLAGTLVGKIQKQTSVSSACVSVALCLLFTYWIVYGGNNGFAGILRFNKLIPSGNPCFNTFLVTEERISLANSKSTSIFILFNSKFQFLGFYHFINNVF